MKRVFLSWGGLLSFILVCQLCAAASSSTNQTEIRLSVELRDGSRVVGRSLDETFKFRSPLLGDLKLDAKDIRSIDCSNTNAARLTAVNGDQFAVNFVARELRVSTTFGKVELPVASVRRVSVSVFKPGNKSRPGLVALWSGDGNGDDSVGGNNAELTDTGFGPGKVGDGFQLNGRSSWAKIPANPALDVGKEGGFTITAWINPTSTATYVPILEWGDLGRVGAHFWLGCCPPAPGAIMANIMDTEGESHYFKSDLSVVVKDQFQFVALTYDKSSGQALLFVNGVVVAQSYFGSFTPQTSYDLYISRRPANNPSNAFFRA